MRYHKNKVLSYQMGVAIFPHNAGIRFCQRMQPNGPARRGDIILQQNAAQWPHAQQRRCNLKTLVHIE